MKTQAELDAALIAAADQFGTDLIVMPLLDAVRARREAMRPHKAAVLNAIRIEHDRVAIYSKHGDLDQLEMWEAADSDRKEWIRNLLARILAAPDEPQP